MRFIGPVGPATERSELLGGADALLHLIDFDEPFGYSVVEAMACGTPVIAYRRGSMPELIEAGRSGFLVENPTTRSPPWRRPGASTAGRYGAWPSRGSAWPGWWPPTRMSIAGSCSANVERSTPPCRFLPARPRHPGTGSEVGGRDAVGQVGLRAARAGFPTAVPVGSGSRSVGSAEAGKPSCRWW